MILVLFFSQKKEIVEFLLSPSFKILVIQSILKIKFTYIIFKYMIIYKYMIILAD